MFTKPLEAVATGRLVGGRLVSATWHWVFRAARNYPFTTNIGPDRPGCAQVAMAVAVVTSQPSESTTDRSSVYTCVSSRTRLVTATRVHGSSWAAHCSVHWPRAGGERNLGNGRLWFSLGPYYYLPLLLGNDPYTHARKIYMF